ncbi:MULTISPECIES: hypothetical protein [unclassified Brevundimonas]|nr:MULTISPECIES: hypothetical protein [unclassified Brevundimonas]
MREEKPSNLLLVSVATLFAATLAYTIFDLGRFLLGALSGWLS